MIDKGKLENYWFFISLFLMVLGIIGFATGFIVSMNTEIPEKTLMRLPLGDLEGVAVDDKDKIYCVSTFYSRVQAYDQNGRFLYGLKIPAKGGIFNINIDASQNLTVQIPYDILYVFNKNGKLIAEKQNNEENEYGDSESRLAFTDQSGNQYRIKSSILFPHITKMTPDGKEKTVVTNSLWEWFLAGPLPAWFFFAFGFISIFIILGLPSLLFDAKKKQNEARRSKKPIIEV